MTTDVDEWDEWRVESEPANVEGLERLRERLAAVKPGRDDLDMSGDGGDDEPELRFATPTEFVRWLAGVYRRDVVNDRELRWCPEWFEHEEAAILLVDLWRTYESLRREKAGGMSTWFRDHVNPHMRTLMSAQGPLKGCSETKGHHLLPPLPVNDPPAGWWNPEDSGP